MALVGNGIRLNGNPGVYSGWSGAFTADVVTRLKTHSNMRPIWYGEHALVGSPGGGAGVWTYGSSILNANNKSSSSSWSPTTSGDLTAGEVGILQISFDNINAVDGDNVEVTSVTDAAGNTWTKAREQTYAAGATAAGATVSLWYCNVTNTLASGAAVTINFSSAIVAKVAQLNRFTVTAGATASVVGSDAEIQSVTDPGSLTVTPSSGSREHLFYRAIALERAVGSITPTASYTAIADGATSGGLSSSNIYGTGEWRIFTGASDTSNPTVSATDSASVFVAFDVNIPSTLSNQINKNGWPMGSTHPHCWVMPIKAGGMACRNEMSGSGDVTAANLAGGLNGVAALTGTGDITSATGQLIVSATANLTGTGTISAADLRAFLNAVAALTGSGDITTANRTAIGHMEAAATGTGTITVTVGASGSMSADIVSTGEVLTAESCAAAVMASIIEAGYDLRDVIALLAARELGASTGGPAAPAYKGLDGTTTRVAASSVNSSGDRSGITLTPG